MILNVQFFGFDEIAGREILPGLYPMKPPRSVELPQVAAAEWHGETFCTAAILREVAGRLLHLRAYLRCLNQATGRADRVMFFVGVADLFGNVIEYKPAPIANTGGTTAAYNTILGGGGAVITRPRFEYAGASIEERRAICSACPYLSVGPPAACERLRCCGKDEPDPARYGMMISHDYGWCPERKWGGPDGERKAPRLFKREIEIGGKKYEAV